MKNFRYLLAAGAAAFGLMSPSVASAADSGVSFVATNAGYDGVYNSRSAGNYKFNVEGVDVIVYCGDKPKAFDQSASFSVVSAGASGIPNVADAGHVASTAASVGTPLADANAEAAAVQLAVWVSTNGAVLDATSVPYPDILARATELADALGDVPVPGPATFDLALAATSAAGDDGVGFVATLTGDGAPLAGQTVTFTSAAGSTDVVTDAAGMAVLTVNAAAGESVQVSWSGEIPAGSVLMPDNGSQPMIIAQPVPVTRSVSVTATGASTETTSSTVVTPTSGTLAHTGGSGSLPQKVAFGAALAVVAVFGVRRMVARKV